VSPLPVSSAGRDRIVGEAGDIKSSSSPKLLISAKYRSAHYSVVATREGDHHFKICMNPRHVMGGAVRFFFFAGGLMPSADALSVHAEKALP